MHGAYNVIYRRIGGVQLKRGRQAAKRRVVFTLSLYTGLWCEIREGAHYTA
jgi:hypothetical protein